jgi:probable rRNA maturation factor
MSDRQRRNIADREPLSATRPAQQTLTIDIAIDDDDVAAWAQIDDAEAKVLAAAATIANAKKLKIGHAAATVVLATDSELKALNKAHRGKDKPTNVLSFPSVQIAGAVATSDAPRFLGDVILAIETLMREADDLAIAPTHHLQHLVVHGLLHLLGFDHETDAEAETMETLETALLKTLGIADPYSEKT